MNVPVSIRVNDIDDIEKIVVLVDHNPIHRVLNFYPGKAEPYLTFRIKMQEATPIRAAVLTASGQWHVGGVWLDAPGGGCTTASVSQASRLWETDLNLVAAKVWRRKDGGERLRMRMIHPMDTGLVSNIPAFYLESLALQLPDGEQLARLETFEPVSENPVFTFSIASEHASGEGYVLEGRDNNANLLRVNVPRGFEVLDLQPTVASQTF